MCLCRWYVYGIFDNEDKTITKDSIVWVNTNKTTREIRINKFIYSDLPHDSNDLKMI